MEEEQEEGEEEGGGLGKGREVWHVCSAARACVARRNVVWIVAMVGLVKSI